MRISAGCAVKEAERSGQARLDKSEICSALRFIPHSSEGPLAALIRLRIACPLASARDGSPGGCEGPRSAVASLDCPMPDPSGRVCPPGTGSPHPAPFRAATGRETGRLEGLFHVPGRAARALWITPPRKPSGARIGSRSYHPCMKEKVCPEGRAAAGGAFRAAGGAPPPPEPRRTDREVRVESPLFPTVGGETVEAHMDGRSMHASFRQTPMDTGGETDDLAAS